MSNCKRNKNNFNREDDSGNPMHNDQFNEVIKNSFNLQESSFGMSKSNCQRKYLELLIEQIKQNSAQIDKLKQFSSLSMLNAQLESKPRGASEYRKRKKENSAMTNTNTNVDNLITNTTAEDISKLISNLEAEYQSHIRKMKIDTDAKVNEKKLELNKEREEALNEKNYVLYALENEQEMIQKEISLKKKSTISIEQSKAIQANLEANYQEIISMKKFIINDYYKEFIEKKKNETISLAKNNSDLLKRGNNSEGAKPINQIKSQAKSNKTVGDKTINGPQSQKNLKPKKDIPVAANQNKKPNDKNKKEG